MLPPRRSGVVLDVGTGTGEIARALALRGVPVDALDPSAAMLERGQQLSGGKHSLLTWILGTAEEAPLHGPYGLIVAAASLHWLDWEIVLPRFRQLLAPGGVLAIVEQRQVPQPWDSALGQVIARFSLNRSYRPYDLVAELEQRGLFLTLGHLQTDSVPFAQLVAEYVESFHARNGFSRDRMHPHDAAAFDAEADRLVRHYAQDGCVALETSGLLIWGHPAPR